MGFKPGALEQLHRLRRGTVAIRGRGKGLLAGVALGIVAAAPGAAASSDPATNRWPGQVSVEIKPGTERSVGRLDVFWPFWQGPDRLLYVDGRVVDASGPSFEGNVGVGYRQLLPAVRVLNSEVVYGVYGFFDRRKTANENYFSQGTFGAEVMSENVSLRANAYLPERSSHVVARRTVTTAAANPGAVALTGTDVVVTGRTSAASTVLEARERALPGFDVELGLRAPMARLGVPENHELWLYGGYFRFDRSESPEVEGVRGRLEYRVHDAFGWAGSALSIGGEVRDDDLRGTEAFALVRLRVPFGARASSPRDLRQARITRMMTAFVERDVDVVAVAQDINAPAGSALAPERQEIPAAALPDVPVTDPQSGESLNVYFVDGTGGGDCSRGNPCTVTAAQAKPAYGAGDVLVVIDNSGVIDNAIPLARARQKVVGGGDSGSTSVTLSSGDAVTLAGLGGRATVRGAVTLGPDSEVKGFDITNPGGDGIVAAGQSGFTVSDVNVDAAAVGVRVSGASSGTFNDVSVSNATTAGAVVDSLSGAVSFNRGTFTDNAGFAFDVNGGSGTINLADVTINQTGALAGAGIDIDGGSSTFNFGGGSSLNQGAGERALNIENGHTGRFAQAAGASIVATSAMGMNANTGLNFDGANGTYVFDGTTTLGGRARVVLAASNGAFTFGANTSVTNPTSGQPLAVSGGNATVDYAGDITLTGASRSVRISNGHAGSVTFRDGTIAESAAGLGVDFNNADGVYRFLGTTNLDGAGSRINISNGSAGTFEFSNLGMAIRMGNAVIIVADAAATQNVTIANSTLPAGGIRADTMGAGNLCLDISGNTVGGGISITNTAGTLNVVQASAMALSAANNNAVVTPVGTIGFGPPTTACP